MTTSSVEAYPSVEGLVQSTEVSVEVEGHDIWTEYLKRPMPDYAPDWFRESDLIGDLAVNIACFACEGPCVVRLKASVPVSSVVVRPKSKRIPVDVDGSDIRLQIPGPCKLLVEIDGLAPLLIFAEPVETDIPEPGGDVRVFGPGVHEPGIIELRDGERIYISPGAIVYGGLRGGAEGARMYGRGILDGSRLDDGMVVLEGASGIEIEGITLRCGNAWQNTLINCDGITYRGVKVLSFVPYGDGIDPCSSRNIRIEDCFFRCSDDCISVKAHDYGPSLSRITVEGCTMAGYAFSDGFTIGFEVVTESITDVVVRDCDILYARGSNKIGGHSAFSIICDGPADISDVSFENIRVEEDVLKAFELNVTDGGVYVNQPPGRISNVRVKNVTWEADGPIMLTGNDERHSVSNVAFEGCTVAGKQITRDDIQLNEFTYEVEVL
jgi:hypothetical protein